MPTTKQLTTEVPSSVFAKGSSASETMKKMFPGAPQYSGYTPEVVNNAGKILIQSKDVGNIGDPTDPSFTATQGYYNFAGGFDRDYGAAPKIDDATIGTAVQAWGGTLGGGGAPGTAHSPATAAPGEGSTNPTTIPVIDPAVLRESEGGGGAFNGPKFGEDLSSLTKKIAAQELGKLQLGKSEPAP